MYVYLYKPETSKNTHLYGDDADSSICTAWNVEGFIGEVGEFVVEGTDFPSDVCLRCVKQFDSLLLRGKVSYGEFPELESGVISWDMEVEVSDEFKDLFWGQTLRRDRP